MGEKEPKAAHCTAAPGKTRTPKKLQLSFGSAKALAALCLPSTIFQVPKPLGWWNGRHVRLRGVCRKACGFKSRPEHPLFTLLRGEIRPLISLVNGCFYPYFPYFLPAPCQRNLDLRWQIVGKFS